VSDGSVYVSPHGFRASRTWHTTLPPHANCSSSPIILNNCHRPQCLSNVLRYSTARPLGLVWSPGHTVCHNCPGLSMHLTTPVFLSSRCQRLTTSTPIHQNRVCSPTLDHRVLLATLSHFRPTSKLNLSTHGTSVDLLLC
jgi:hypothetical protein